MLLTIGASFLMSCLPCGTVVARRWHSIVLRRARSLVEGSSYRYTAVLYVDSKVVLIIFARCKDM